uniref:Uncharacterized protein n=1 Tax=Arundo donax TaxID=35708 RepID=A0A0A8YC44_ARUDO
MITGFEIDRGILTWRGCRAHLVWSQRVDCHGGQVFQGSLAHQAVLGWVQTSGCRRGTSKRASPLS